MTKEFDPDDPGSPTYYLTWWWTSRRCEHWLQPDYSSYDEPFHNWASRVLGHSPDPVWRPEEHVRFEQRYHAARDLWVYLKSRHLEGKPVFTEGDK